MLDIVYCCDDGYSPYVGVSMISCIKNNIDDFEKITFHIIEENISEKNKSKLKKITDSYTNCTLKFYPFSCNVKIPKSSYPPIGYATIFLSELLPIDKVIYVDGDTLILNSFKNLMQLDLKNNYAAGVLDPSPSIGRKELGFSENEPYFNAGVLLFDLKKIKENGIQEKFTEEAKKPYKCHDQDIINYVLKDKISIIPIKYNFFGQFLELDYCSVINICSLKNNFYSKQSVENSKNSIVCTHFLNFFHDVPWKDKTNPMYNEFEKYFKMTPFTKDEIFVPSSFPIWKIIMHTLLRNIPPKFYIKIAKYYLKKIYEN